MNNKDLVLLMAAVLASVLASAAGLYLLVRLLAYMWRLA